MIEIVHQGILSFFPLFTNHYRAPPQVNIHDCIRRLKQMFVCGNIQGVSGDWKMFGCGNIQAVSGNWKMFVCGNIQTVSGDWKMLVWGNKQALSEDWKKCLFVATYMIQAVSGNWKMFVCGNIQAVSGNWKMFVCGNIQAVKSRLSISEFSGYHCIKSGIYSKKVENCQFDIPSTLFISPSLSL